MTAELQKSQASSLCHRGFPLLRFQAFQHDGAQVVLRRRRLRSQPERGDGEDGRHERQGVTEDLHVRHGERRNGHGASCARTSG